MEHKLYLALILFLFHSTSYAMSNEERIEQSRGIVKSFMGELKHQLKSTLKQDGPVAALKVCNVSAPSIAKKQSDLHGFDVARTSLKFRNPNNAPDAWEEKVLLLFEQRKADGEAIKDLEHSEIVSVNGQQWFRYMKAISTAEKPCLLCHGDHLKPEIAATIDELYPTDKARGYKAGDIRGAFTLRQVVKP